MQWCVEHWTQLRLKVEASPIASLIASSGERMAENTARDIESGETTLDTFDPLMGAYWAMIAFISESMGPGGAIAVLVLEGCPICKVDDVHQKLCKDDPCTYGSITKFFDNAVADQVAIYQELVK